MNEPLGMDEPQMSALEKELREQRAPSASAPSETACQPRSLALATCSLPVSHVEFYIYKWETHLALCVPGYADKEMRMVEIFLEDLRAMKAAANVRQPRENAKAQP